MPIEYQMDAGFFWALTDDGMMVTDLMHKVGRSQDRGPIMLWVSPGGAAFVGTHGDLVEFAIS